VVADGMPLVWASRLQGTPLPERVAGSNLAWSASAVAANRRAAVFLLGGNPGVATEASRRLVAAVPGLRVVGTFSPPFGFERDPGAVPEMVQRIAESEARMVLVGLSFPKQELLIEQLRRACPDVWFLGVGISLSFIAGDVGRAPRWMQVHGLEWAHRLSQEPRRLAKRYLVHGLPFALRLLGSALQARAKTTRAASGSAAS
jgi:N-acetylglucosaminyldiphosphoundecaprenol N-acetyl-beta-D-mannosaminyltransferase